MMCPDHPDIVSAEITGYPRSHWNNAKIKRIRCEECGEDITDDEQYYDSNHENLCKNCLLFYHIKDW